MPTNLAARLAKLPLRAKILTAATVLAVTALTWSHLNGDSGSAFSSTPTVVNTTSQGRAGVPVQKDSTGPAASSAPADPHNAATETGDHAEDGTDDGAPTVQVTTDPAVQEAAAAFVAAWLNTANRSPQMWRNGLFDQVTPDLAAYLAEADPASVPAGTKAAAVTVTKQGSLMGAEVKVVTTEPTPQQAGTLTLTLVQRGGRWLTSEFDWEFSR